MKAAAVAAVVLVATGVFVAEFARVHGSSMEPTLSSGDRIIFEKISMRRGGPARFDIVVFKAPNDPDTIYIKRVVGLPDEVVEARAGRLVVNGVETPLPAGVSWGTADVAPAAVGPAHYFVTGDNLAESVDSRQWGAVPRDYILGTVWLRFWPAGKMTVFKRESAAATGARDGDKGI